MVSAVGELSRTTGRVGPEVRVAVVGGIEIEAEGATGAATGSASTTGSGAGDGGDDGNGLGSVAIRFLGKIERLPDPRRV